VSPLVTVFQFVDVPAMQRVDGTSGVTPVLSPS
jgi:hypothetical protein